MNINLQPIGIIHTPFQTLEGMPIQPAGAQGVKGTVEIFAEFREGLKDLDGFSHVVLIYYFHKSSGYKLNVVPYMDTEPRGLFATRAPKRPNPIGLSVVQLDKIENGALYVQHIDVLDGTPLLDIKPFVPEFDTYNNIRVGWLEQVRNAVFTKKSDDVLNDMNIDFLNLFYPYPVRIGAFHDLKRTRSEID